METLPLTMDSRPACWGGSSSCAGEAIGNSATHDAANPSRNVLKNEPCFMVFLSLVAATPAGSAGVRLGEIGKAKRVYDSGPRCTSWVQSRHSQCLRNGKPGSRRKVAFCRDEWNFDPPDPFCLDAACRMAACTEDREQVSSGPRTACRIAE